MSAARSLTVAERISAAADRLVARTVELTLRDPFWSARFGARVSHITTDTRYHVSYLDQALLAEDPAILERYARWLRMILVTRGMCTRHLDEDLGRLATVIAVEVPEASRAVAYLDRARAALRHHGIAGELDAVVDDLVGAAVKRIEARPDAAAGFADRRGIALEEEMGHVTSFWLDAVALERPDLFAAHVAWLEEFHARSGIPGAVLAVGLAALDDALGATSASDAARREARDVLVAARRRGEGVHA